MVVDQIWNPVLKIHGTNWQKDIKTHITTRLYIDCNQILKKLGYFKIFLSFFRYYFLVAKAGVAQKMSSEEKIGTLEDEAAKRKERLKNLKKKHEEQGKEENKISGEAGNLPK